MVKKILKAKTKARYGKKSNFHIFFSFLGLLGSENSCVAVFLVFKVENVVDGSSASSAR